MGTHINFQNFGNGSSGGGEAGNATKPTTGNNVPLSRQSSIYSLTFDELQSTLGGGLGKDFGSMNMDELLKNIWSAEESQVMVSSSTSAVVGQSGGGGGNSVPMVNLQRQGSLTLPRTLSQKTVDEVWRDLVTVESNGGNTGSSGENGGNGLSNAPPRQRTLGEMTLEEFLVRAGVVREDNYVQPHGRINGNTNGFYGNSNAGLALGFGQANQNSISFGANDNNSMILNQPQPGFSGTRQKQQQPQPQLLLQSRPQMLQPRPQLQPQTLFPKQTNGVVAGPVNTINSSLAGVSDNAVNNNSSLVGLGTGVTVSIASPGTSSADNNSLSPVPYTFGRGRRSNAALEKVIERRQRRMIKNRESAARSRARKQAYTLELEAEVEQLKKLNQELQKKQVEMMEMQKNELKESLNRPWGSKRQCLRRTLTGPW